MALCSVASLLAWVFGLGSFAVWFWAFSAPAVLLLAIVLARATRHGRRPDLRTAVVAGTVGGLLGTFGYDLFRLPFHLAGLRLLAPIDSYGVLLLGADHSNDVTGLAGWLYHVTNGVGFGIAYAVVASGRRWWWAVVWAMVLETATIVTPFVGTYDLRGKWAIIGIAYAAHVAYGVPLGRWVERAGTRVPQLLEMTKRPIAVALVTTVMGLVLWHHPWSVLDEGDALATGAARVDVRDGRFVPRWLRVAPGGCVLLQNRDRAGYTVKGGASEVRLPPRGTARPCFEDAGVHRVRTSNRPDAGGFVIVDSELSRGPPSPVVTSPAASATSTIPLVAATQPCPHPDNGEQITAVNDAFVQATGVWAVLPAEHPARTPVLLGTRDHGKSWTYHCLPHAASGESVFFADDKRGWAVVVNRESSTSLVLRTVDGGVTWGAGALPTGPLVLRDAFFLDERRGWATGERAGSAVVLHSDDGGASWSELAAPAGSGSPDEVRFASATSGWILDDGGRIASSSDSGATWTVGSLEPGFTYTDMAFADGQTGWIVGNDTARGHGHVWTSTDRGATWKRTGEFSHPLNDVTVDGRGVVRASGGPEGTVEVSGDGGRTWRAQPALPSLTEVWALDDTRAWGYSRDADRAGCLYSSFTAQGEPGIWTAHVLFNTPGCRATHA